MMTAARLAQERKTFIFDLSQSIISSATLLDHMFGKRTSCISAGWRYSVNANMKLSDVLRREKVTVDRIRRCSSQRPLETNHRLNEVVVVRHMLDRKNRV